MRASRTAADHHCIAFHGKLDLSSLRTTQQRNRGHAVRVPGMHGLLQARAVLRSLTPGTLRHLYRNAMQMEVDFFNAQPDVSSAPSVGMLVIDFDDTCTVTDTTSLVFNTAIDATVEATQESERTAVRKRLEAMRDQLVQNYVQEQQRLYSELIPEGGGSSNEAGQQKAFVEALSDFDRRMNQVVVDSAILQGIPEGRLTAAGQLIGLQPGCLTVLSRAQQLGVPTHVVSVNYSSKMVQAALRRSRLNPIISEASDSSQPRDIVIHANELSYKDGFSTGDIIRRVQGGSDKDALMMQLMQQSSSAHTPPNSSNNHGSADESKLAVYVGDSPSDFAPLLRADLGIVVGQNKLLRRVAKAQGVKLKPLTAAPANGHAEPLSLYEAESWAAIGAFLFGPDPSKALTPHPSTQEGTNAVKVPRVLTVAGSDSGGGAGIQADLKTYQARGVFGASAISALTAQNTRGVKGVHTVPSQHLSDQMEAVLSDIGADVIKTGMLPTAEAVEAVAEQVQRHQVSALVVDPVLVATSGDSLAGSEVAQALKTHLFPLATVITPNLPEASALLGGQPVDDLDSMKQAAQELHKLGPKYILIKGGHLIEPPSSTHAQADPNNSTQSTGSSAAGHSGPSAPQTSPEATSAAHDSPAQSSEPAAAASCAEPEPPADASLSEKKNGHGGLSVGQELGDTQSDRHSAAAEQATNLPEGGGGGGGDHTAGAASPSNGSESNGSESKHHSGDTAVDVLFDGEEMHVLQAKRVHTQNTHGTGCTLASAIAAELAKGHQPLVAVQKAKAWLSSVLQASAAVHIGTGPHKPLNHGFETNDWAQQPVKPPSNLHKPALDYRLYAVTDPACNARCQRSNAEAVRQAIQGGVTLVQLREKDADGGAFIREAEQVMQVANESGVGVIINDRVDVALAVGAHGVHVGQNDIPARTARQLLGPGKVLGVSVKTVEQAQQAAADGADYLGAGAMFATATKDSSTITQETLQQICEAVDIPVVAIGGMNAANATSTLQAGCHGIAVVSAIFGAQDAVAAAQEIREAVDITLGNT
ncbi:hypothetical protein ABBQ38_014648 [Trebouxia sp. C0009 RCD-2024]